jgi:hypothetical protein
MMAAHRYPITDLRDRQVRVDKRRTRVHAATRHPPSLEQERESRSYPGHRLKRSYCLSKTSVSSYELIGRLMERLRSPGVVLLLHRSDRRAFSWSPASLQTTTMTIEVSKDE